MTCTSTRWQIVRRLSFTALALAALSGCGDIDTVEDAAASLDAPATFTEVSAETLNGFEATTHRITFETEISQADACDAARDALTAWAGQSLPEPRSALPRNLCSYELSNPVNFPGVDFAAARVYRAKIGAEFIEDETAPGGVDEITIFFSTDK